LGRFRLAGPDGLDWPCPSMLKLESEKGAASH
jgi:hypothetical protein